ncbi:MAG TPA: family 10 glycosylhydrolase [Saprospiraceae bacterium]|nr:family 10 glycosylhydrolase [Saprospiraceae bacterium]HMQ85118.1 family 10 glycosylhydrolase [Saprospiraceae bacterium]
MKIKLGVFILLLSMLFENSFAQSGKTGDAPKHEFRGVWVATVNNLDYPSKSTPWPTAHKEEWKNLISKYKELGFNAVIFQIRPAGDAFYPSEFAPWSRYLTGKQDLPPKPEYDPLAFIIEETHRQGMEFHAWMNPFRLSMDLDSSQLSIRHAFYQHRNWVVRYGKRYYLNPGLPEVRNHLRDVVAEVVQKYDVDAIHFDDYFYPYPIANEAFPDSLTYKYYGAATHKDIGNWRRQNIDEFVELISTTIKAIKPEVQFGISPFGVWRNKDKDPAGSDSRASVSSYDDLYADVVKWLRLEWIDYVVPQIYWNIGYEVADYNKLVNWWSQHQYNGKVYIGHAAYKIGQDAQPGWQEPDQMARQIRLTRRNRRIDGSVFFRSGSVLADPKNLKDTLRYYYANLALPPKNENLSLPIQAEPAQVKVKNKRGDAQIRWKPNKNDVAKPPHYYAVYRFKGTTVRDLEEATNLIHLSSFATKDKKYAILDKRIEEGETYTYAITAVNRANSEGRISEAVTIQRKNGRIVKYKSQAAKARKRKKK